MCGIICYVVKFKIFVKWIAEHFFAKYYNYRLSTNTHTHTKQYVYKSTIREYFLIDLALLPQIRIFHMYYDKVCKRNILQNYKIYFTKNSDANRIEKLSHMASLHLKPSTSFFCTFV